MKLSENHDIGVKSTEKMLSLENITIRTELQPGDIGYITHLHGALYKKEYNYGIPFEIYVAEGLCEFFRNFQPDRNAVWICEHDSRIVGFLLLMDRGEAAQLRYFILEPDYRGIGLGAKLMELYMQFLKKKGFTSSYLWTTDELPTAIHLYTKFGFKLTEEKPSTSFGKAVVERRYEWKP